MDNTTIVIITLHPPPIALSNCGPHLYELPDYSNPPYTPLNVPIVHPWSMSLLKWKPHCTVRFSKYWVWMMSRYQNLVAFIACMSSTTFRYNIIFFSLLGSESYGAFKDALEKELHVIIFAWIITFSAILVRYLSHLSTTLLFALFYWLFIAAVLEKKK